MATRKIYSEAVEGNQSVKFYKRLHEVVTEDGMQLLMTQKSPVGKKALAPVMLVHGLGQNRFSWTLSKRSMENYLVSLGFTTFNVELRGHGLSRANGSQYPTTFENYLTYDIPAFIQEIQNITGRKKMFFIGHSLGGTISYCVGPLFQDSLLGIISFAGPYAMAKGNPFLKTVAFMGSTAFKVLPMKHFHSQPFPIDYVGVVAKMGLFALDHPWNHFAIQVWQPGSMERDVLEERIAKGFDRTSISVARLLVDWGARGKLHGTGGKENYEDRIADLKIPILFVNGDRDYAVPPSAAKPAWENAPSNDKTFLVFNKKGTGVHWGHCDLISGKNAPAHVWPIVGDWLADRANGSGKSAA